MLDEKHEALKGQSHLNPKITHTTSDTCFHIKLNDKDDDLTSKQPPPQFEGIK